MTVLLVDADILVYRAGFAAQKSNYVFKHNDGSTIDLKTSKQKEIISKLKELKLTKKFGSVKKLTTAEPVSHACYLVKRMIMQLVEKFEPETVELYLTADDESNFRYEVATLKPYKGNRTQPKPIHYEALRNYLKSYWRAKIISDMEADDALAIAQCSRLCSGCQSCLFTRQHYASPNNVSIIVSLDKDLNMIPGYHYNFVTEEGFSVWGLGKLILSKNHKSLKGYGLKWFYAQMLLGDSADNIPGVKGFGPVATFNALKGLKTEALLAKAVYDVYTKIYEGPENKIKERMYEVADLLWIKQSKDDCKSNDLKEIL